MKEKQSENLPLKNPGSGSVTDNSDVTEKYPWHLLLQTVVLLNAFLGESQIGTTYDGHMRSLTMGDFSRTAKILSWFLWRKQKINDLLCSSAGPDGGCDRTNPAGPEGPGGDDAGPDLYCNVL